jgi:hypothetical protein
MFGPFLFTTQSFSRQRFNIKNAYQPTFQPDQIHQRVGGPTKEGYKIFSPGI